MIKTLKTGVLLCVLASFSHSSWFDANLVKKTEEIKEQNNKTQVELQAIKNAQFYLSAQLNMNNTAIAQIKADLQAQADAIVGVGNKIEHTNETVGGDKNTTNDTEMVKALIESYRNTIDILVKQMIALISLFVVQVFVLLTLYARKDEKLNKYFMDYISEDEEREDKKND